MDTLWTFIDGEDFVVPYVENDEIRDRFREEEIMLIFTNRFKMFHSQTSLLSFINYISQML